MKGHNESQIPNRFYFAEKCQYLTKFKEDRTQDTDKNKKILINVGQKYQIPIWYRHFRGIPNFLLPIDITISPVPSRLGLARRPGPTR